MDLPQMLEVGGIFGVSGEAAGEEAEHGSGLVGGWVCIWMARVVACACRIRGVEIGFGGDS